MSRVDTMQEKTLMPPSAHHKNIEGFKRILPNFYLDYKSEEAVVSTLHPLSRSWKDNYLDSYYNLNSQRRAFYKIDDTLSSYAHDKGYMLYKKHLENAWYQHFPTKDEKYAFRDRISNYKLFDYDVYKQGKITVGKQKQKLFKFMIKHKILTQTQIEEITTIKVDRSYLYLCISRNPIDYLFCSTNQNFTSCEDLRSSYEGAFYMGLGGLSLDPNRVILFTTKGETLDYNVLGNTFTHFKYICRSWGIVSSQKAMHVVRHYPEAHVDIRNELQKSGIKTTQNLKNSGLFSYKLPKHENDENSMIYLDTVGLYRNRKGAYRYDTRNGRAGCNVEFNYGGGFENASCFSDFIDGFYCECDNCGGRIQYEDDAHYMDDYRYCRHCFDESYFWCYNCGDAHHIDNSYDVEGDLYCERCHQEQAGTCDECGEDIRHSNMRHRDEGSFCSYCFSKLYTHCDQCGNMHFKADMTDHSDGTFCIDCYEEYYKTCPGCDIEYHIDDLTDGLCYNCNE